VAVADGDLDHADRVALDPPRVFSRPFPDSTGWHLRRRAFQIVRVATKNFGPLLRRGMRDKALPPEVVAVPLRKTIEELGATFMKFGQLIGSAPGVFGEEMSAEFRSCLDTGAPVPLDRVRYEIECDLGIALEDVFAEFEPTPIGRASIAVVHRAKLHDGRTVAVKVLRPGIERMVAVDLDLMQPLLDLVARQTGDQLAGSLVQMFDGFREQMGEELDLRNECRAMEHYRVLLDLVDLPLVAVPEPFRELSGSRVLTMEYFDGVPIDDVARIEDFGHNPRPMMEQVVRGFLMTAIRWGTFHGDVHAGNMLLLRDGRIGVIDWGIVGRLDPESHKFLRRLIQGGLGDETAWADIAAHIVNTYGPAIQEGLQLSDDELVVFIRTMMEPVLTQPFGEVSLSAMIMGPQEQVAKARGIEATDRSVVNILRRFREQRRVRALAEAHGGVNSDFDRATFLLSKQLMYFERYGKMYMGDVSLFEDQEFFRALLFDDA
jgi:predicted unusual protein kinase regulating ubiquinone biosynthesis (AarF/ABC1/UbiB family)